MGLHIRLCLSQASTLDLFQDRGAFRFPTVRLGLEVVMCEVDVDGRDEFGNAGEAPLAHDVVGQLPEEPFDEIQP